MKLATIIKFPTKARRKYYANKLFSLNSLVEITRIAAGIVIGEIVYNIIFKGTFHG